MGTDRILYETYPDAGTWFEGVDINTMDTLKIGRENANKFFKLQEYKVANAAYFQALPL